MGPQSHWTRWVALASVAAFLPATLVSAQTAPPPDPITEDWRPSQTDDVTAAYLLFDVGVGLVVRCVGGERMDGLITGLPAAEGRTRTLRAAIDAPPTQDRSWYVGRDRTTVVATSPAEFARWLRGGGVLALVVPGVGEGGRNLRYMLDLPASDAAINQVLAACGRPSVDPREELAEPASENGLPVGLSWIRMPRPTYPQQRRTYEWGFASVTCLTQRNGSLAECQIEAEHPQDGGFGAATLRAMRDARIQVTDQPGAPVPTRIVSFVVRFRMGDSGVTFENPTRLRRQD